MRQNPPDHSRIFNACNNVLTVGALLNCLFGKVSADAVRIAGNATAIRAESHAPIGVMGDHVHSKGECMVFYRYMNLHMEDLHEGSERVTAEEVVTSACPKNVTALIFL